MSNTNILQLPIAIGLSGSEYIPLVQGTGSDAVTRRAAASLFAGFPVTSMQLANVVFAGPASGAAAAPAFRALVDEDLPVVPATKGGTGVSSYVVGDILFADTTSSLAKLADVATGNALISGGVGVAPAWGKIGLTTHVSGVLPVANGGTGTATSFTSGSVVFAGSSGVYSQDNTNLFWNDTDNRLGVGNNSPQQTLDVGGTGAVFNTYLRVWTNDVSNTLVGYGAGQSLVTPATSHNGDGNTLVGSGAGFNMTTAFATTIVGGNSGYALVEGDSNTIFGYQCGSAMVDAKWNVLIGVDVMPSDVSARDMVVIGHHAGTNLTHPAESGESVYVGSESIKLGVGGVGTVAVGYRTAYNSNASAVSNVWVGHLAGFSNTSGSQITAVGKDALFSNTNGVENGALGYRALYNTTVGDNNCAFGNFAGFTNTTGNSSVFFGNNAGFYETASSRLYIDNASRADLAAGRANALVYGVFGTGPSDQSLQINGQLIAYGTATNDNAAAGQIGEFISGSLAFASRVTLTSSAGANVISISLTAGDWDVSGAVSFEKDTTTSITYMIASLSTTSATLGSEAQQTTLTNLATGAGTNTCAIPSQRISIASTTTVYLVAQAAFATSFCKAYGSIFARRAR